MSTKVHSTMMSYVLAKAFMFQPRKSRHEYAMGKDGTTAASASTGGGFNNCGLLPNRTGVLKSALSEAGE